MMFLAFQSHTVVWAERARGASPLVVSLSHLKPKHKHTESRARTQVNTANTHTLHRQAHPQTTARVTDTLAWGAA